MVPIGRGDEIYEESKGKYDERKGDEQMTYFKSLERVVDVLRFIAWLLWVPAEMWREHSYFQ